MPQPEKRWKEQSFQMIQRMEEGMAMLREMHKRVSTLAHVDSTEAVSVFDTLIEGLDILRDTIEKEE